MNFTSYIPYYKRNLLLALPVMLSQAGQVLVQQVDNMMVGSVGTMELAAASFANNVFIIGLALGMGFTFGLTPLVGHAWGSKDHSLSSKLLLNSTIVNICFSFILMIVMYSISFFMDRMGQEAQMVKLAIPYYRVIVLSVLPFVLFFTLKQFAEGIGSTIYAMFITLSANVINVIFNYLFIFGKFGFPELGLLGAGYGTLIARIFMTAMFLLVFTYKNPFREYLVAAIKCQIDIKLIRKLFDVGWPIAAQILLEVLAFALGALMIGWLGAIPLAAHQIAIGLASITFMIATGVSSATTIRVSHQYSSGNYEAMKKATFGSVHLVLMFMSVTAILFYTLRNQLPQLYIADQDVIAVASQLLILAAIFQVFDGFQVVILGALRGLADVKHAMKISFISYILISLPLSYTFAFLLNFGPAGVWVGFVVSLGIAGFLFLRRFNSLRKGIQ